MKYKVKKRESLINFILKVVEITRSDAEEIAESFHSIELKEKDYLLRENQKSDDYVYLETGLLRTFLHDLNG